MRRKLVLGALVVVGALALVAGALAADGYGNGSSSDSSGSTADVSSTSSSSAAAGSTYTFKAALTAGAEVPKPAGVPAKAGGTFNAKSVESGSKVTIRWTLKFHNLSGKAMAAHIHMAAKGKAGPVVVALCGPCKNGQSGSASITSKIENALEQGKAYVNVHTAKNAAGEVRGQVKLTAST